MLAVYLLVFVIGLWLLRRRRRGKQVGFQLPGPKCLPFVGNALEINEDNLVDKMVELGKVHGDLFGIQMFQQRILCLNSVDDIRELFTGPDYKVHTNNRARFFFAEYVLGLESIAFVREAFSPVHNKMRKGFTKGIHLYGEGITTFEHTVMTELSNLNAKIEATNGGDINVLDLFRMSLANILSITVCCFI